MYIQRIFLEFIFIITTILIVLLYFKLFKDVVRLRKSIKISVGHNESVKLERAIRAHANFNEYVPLSFFLSLILYFHNFLIFSCTSIILLLFGRIYHYKGITNESEKEENFKYRKFGMRLTIYSFFSSIFGLVIYLGQTLYLFLKI